MAKMPLIADPRYSMDEEKAKEIENGLREDVSKTSRDPYPLEYEIGLSRKSITKRSIYAIFFEHDQDQERISVKYGIDHPAS